MQSSKKCGTFFAILLYPPSCRVFASNTDLLNCPSHVAEKIAKSYVTVWAVVLVGGVAREEEAAHVEGGSTGGEDGRKSLGRFGIAASYRAGGPPWCVVVWLGASSFGWARFARRGR